VVHKTVAINFCYFSEPILMISVSR